MKGIVDKLQRIHALTLRRQKMDHQRNVAKTKMAATQSYSAGIHVLGRPRNPKSLHRMKPEVVLRRRSLLDIESPLEAATFMIERLIPKEKGNSSENSDRVFHSSFY